MSRWVTGQMPIYPLPGGTVHSPRGASYLLGQLLGEGSFGAVFDCIGPAGEVEDPEAGGADAWEPQPAPAQRQRLEVVGLQRAVHDRPVVGLADDQPLRIAALDLDLLLDDRQRPP